jgi:hypothetical protein
LGVLGVVTDGLISMSISVSGLSSFNGDVDVDRFSILGLLRGDGVTGRGLPLTYAYESSLSLRDVVGVVVVEVVVVVVVVVVDLVDRRRETNSLISGADAA